MYMKDKLSTLITIIIILLMMTAFGLLGYIVWDNIKDLDVAAEPEQFQTQTSSEDTVDTKTIQTPKVVENNNPFNYGSEEKTKTSNVDYSNINVDKYFYNQLEDASKTIYKAFESSKEKMKSGTYQVELGNSLDNVLNSSVGQDKLSEYYQSAIEAYTYDNPDVFYLSPNKLYLNIETTKTSKGNTYNVYINSGNESNYLIDEFSSSSQVNSALSEINQIKDELVSKKTGNTYEDIKMVHDHLVNNIQYDTSISKQNIYNIYGALVNGEAVCEGYARSFKYIMDELKIPCVLLIGEGTNSQGQTENHAWNYVQLNGNWYAVDVTWDDPILVGGGILTNSSKYKYFLKGASEFNISHVSDGQFTEGGKIFSYPELSEQNY